MGSASDRPDAEDATVAADDPPDRESDLFAPLCPVGQMPHAGFEDVADGNVHEEAIDCLAWFEVVQGSTLSSYSPGSGIRRDQVAALLARTMDWADRALPDTQESHFDDVVGNVHGPAIDQLAAAGVIRGTRPRTYEPDRLVTRAQLAALAVRTYEEITGLPLPGSPGSHFDDVVGDVHADAINRAAEAGLILGAGARTFDPLHPVRRDQAASLLARLLDRLHRDHVGPRPPVIDHIARFGLDDDGGLLQGPATDAAPAASLITVVGRNLPFDPQVTIGDEEVDQDLLVWHPRSIVTVMRPLADLPSTVALTVAPRGRPTDSASIQVTVTEPPLPDGNPEVLIVDYITATRTALLVAGVEAAVLAGELDALEALLPGLSAHEKHSIASGLLAVEATKLLADPASTAAAHEDVRVQLQQGLEDFPVPVPVPLETMYREELRQAGRTAQNAARWLGRANLVITLAQLGFWGAKNANTGPAIRFLFDTDAPLEGSRHGVECHAFDHDGLATGSPWLSIDSGDARFVGVSQRTGTGAPSEWSTVSRPWTTPETGNLRLVRFRCEATDAVEWQTQRTSSLAWGRVIRERQAPQVLTFDARERDGSPPASEFTVGKTFTVTVAATDDVNPDPQWDVVPSGIRRAEMTVGDPVRITVGRDWRGPSRMRGLDLVFREYGAIHGFGHPGAAHNRFFDPNLIHSMKKDEMVLRASMRCERPGTAQIEVWVQDALRNQSVSHLRITCVEQEKPPDPPPPPPPPLSHTLELSKSGTGDGTVTSVPAGIDCGPGCLSQDAAYPPGTTVTLTAEADNESRFVGWSGDCVESDNNAGSNDENGGQNGAGDKVEDEEIDVVMDRSKTCDAEFRMLGDLTLTVWKAGDGDGTVEIQPVDGDGIAVGPPTVCAPGCPVIVVELAELSHFDLHATPDPQSVFIRWRPFTVGSTCVDTGGPVAAGNTMTEDWDCEVEFQLQTVTASVLWIDGYRYPAEQFHLVGPDVGCDHDHYHSESPVHPLEPDGPVLTDPDPGGCGFGPAGLVEETEEEIPRAEWEDYEQRRDASD